MHTVRISPLFILLLILASLKPLNAQSNEGGAVTYEQVIDYGLEGVYDHPKWDTYIADLPKTGKATYTLTFTTEKTLYQEDLNKKALMSRELQGALAKANYAKSPKEVLTKLFYDFAKKEQLEQVEFMTRFFLIQSPVESIDWKLTNKRKKVLNYVCMGAERQVGEEIITAWFTPEIPIAAGPEKYNGLPGLILGLEKNEEVFMLATAISLDKPNEVDISPPQKGQKVSRQKMEKIKVEKIKEFYANRKAKKSGTKK